MLGSELGFESWFCPVCFGFLSSGESFIINSFVSEAELAGPGREGRGSASPLLFKGQLYTCVERLWSQEEDLTTSITFW